jgi:hypothetical protein
MMKSFWDFPSGGVLHRTSSILSLSSIICTGNTISPFATSGGSGYGRSNKELEVVCSGSKVSSRQDDVRRANGSNPVRGSKNINGFPEIAEARFYCS